MWGSCAVCSGKKKKKIEKFSFVEVKKPLMEETQTHENYFIEKRE